MFNNNWKFLEYLEPVSIHLESSSEFSFPRVRAGQETVPGSWFSLGVGWTGCSRKILFSGCGLDIICSMKFSFPRVWAGQESVPGSFVFHWCGLDKLCQGVSFPSVWAGQDATKTVLYLQQEKKNFRGLFFYLRTELPFPRRQRGACDISP